MKADQALIQVIDVYSLTGLGSVVGANVTQGTLTSDMSFKTSRGVFPIAKISRLDLKRVEANPELKALREKMLSITEADVDHSETMMEYAQKAKDMYEYISEVSEGDEVQILVRKAEKDELKGLSGQEVIVGIHQKPGLFARVLSVLKK